MKRPILFSLFFALCICTAFKAQAQYRTAVGLRLGSPLSLSVKHFISDPVALEAYVGTRGYSFYRWTNVSAAVQIHKPLDLGGDFEGLSYYYGVGASVFFWNYNDGFFYGTAGTTNFGVQGYLGIDYALGDLPLNLSLDWIPTFFVGNAFLSGFGAGYGSLGVRYILGR